MSDETTLDELIGGRPTTDEGAKLRAEAISHALDEDYEKYAERRKIATTSQAIIAICKLARPIIETNQSDAIDYVKRMQQAYADESRGGAGQFLICFAELIGIDSTEMLNPTNQETVPSSLIEHAKKTITAKPFARYIAENLDEITTTNSDWQREILLFLDVRPTESLPKAIKERVEFIHNKLQPQTNHDRQTQSGLSRSL